MLLLWFACIPGFYVQKYKNKISTKVIKSLQVNQYYPLFFVPLLRWDVL